MRLFTAIDIPERVKARLGAALNRLRPTASVKWSTPSNFHITTKFIGEWDVDRLEELEKVLGEVPAPEPFEIGIQGVGYFPNPHAPKVFWAGVRAPEELAGLARRIDEALAPLGVERESKKFAPHLTLARIKPPADLAGLRQAVAELPSLDFGSFTADRYFLYESEPTSHGSVYTRLAEFPFG